MFNYKNNNNKKRDHFNIISETLNFVLTRQKYICTIIGIKFLSFTKIL